MTHYRFPEEVQALSTESGEVNSKAMIAEWLPLFFPETNAVFEVRVLAPDGVKGKVKAGYLTGADIRRHAGQIAAVADGSFGAYFTVQGVRPCCLSRCPRSFPSVERIDAATTRPALTSDADVPALRFLIVDIDPVRPAGVSATDAEKLAAFAVANRVLDFMRGHGWAEPLCIDSGNGAHLYYRLPTDGAAEQAPEAGKATAQFMLQELAARFDKAEAKIDQGVFNPSRIMKVPGTWARKGEGTADRPHRLCRVLNVPGDWMSPAASGAPGLDSLAESLDPDGSKRAKPAKREGADGRGGERLALPTPAVVSNASGGRRVAGCPYVVPEPDVCERRARAYVTSQKTPPAHGGTGGAGEKTMFGLARELVDGFLLGHDTALDLLHQEYNPKCEPKFEDWEFRRKLSEVAKTPSTNERGWKYKDDPANKPATRGRESASGVPPTPPAPHAVAGALPPEALPAGGTPGMGAGDAVGVDALEPRHLAETFLASRYRVAGDAVPYRLAYYEGRYLAWSDGAYRAVKDDELANQMTRHAEAEAEREHARKRLDHAGKGKAPVRQRVTRTIVADALAAARARVGLPSGLRPPCWLTPGRTADPRKLIPTTRGVIDLAAGAVLPATPELFTLAASPHYDPDAETPEEILKSLADALADPDSLATAQEFAGYLLTQDTSKQRFLFLQGPPGGGKGTFIRLLSKLVGEEFVGATSFNDLAESHGTADLVGKTLATMGETVVGARTDVASGVMRFLAITGEDAVRINQKNRDPYSVKLSARFVIAANELPAIRTSGAAVTDRALVLRFGKKYRKTSDEDTELGAKIDAAMPGLFAWALAGAIRLHQRGQFVQPEAGAEVLRDFERQTNPLKQFVDEFCVVGPRETVLKGELFSAYESWRAMSRDPYTGTHGQFKSALGNVVLGLGTCHPKCGDGKQREAYRGLRLRTTQDAVAENGESV